MTGYVELGHRRALRVKFDRIVRPDASADKKPNGGALSPVLLRESAIVGLLPSAHGASAKRQAPLRNRP